MKIILILLALLYSLKITAQVNLEWAITPALVITDTIGFNNMAVHSSGTIAATGFRNGGSKTATICLNRKGQLLWQDLKISALQEFNYFLALDSNYFYVSGSIADTSYFDAKLIKYDYNGNMIWIMRYNSPGNGSDGFGFTSIRNQYIYVNGSSTTSTIPIIKKTLLVKLDKLSGDTIWTSFYHNVADSCDNGGGGMAIDISENIFFGGVGSCKSNPEAGLDYNTTKFDSSGAFHWFKTYDGPYVDDSICDPGSNGNPIDYLTGIGLDDSGYVYVAGSSQDCPGAGPGTDFATLKYNPVDGSEIWLRRYNGPSNSLDDCESMIVDKNNAAIYVNGRAKKDFIIQPCIIKYDTDGNLKWERFPMNNIQGSARAIALDDSGYVYVAGGTTPFLQRFITKYDTAGNLIWQQLYPAISSDQDWRQIIVDRDYNVYVRRSNMIAKYCQIPSKTSFAAGNDSVPPGFAVSFTNTSINATHFQWNFGDGTTDTVNFDATHAYAAAGFYTVTLATWNACGADSATLLIHADSLFTGIASIPSPPAPQMLILPNPNNGSFNLSGFNFAQPAVEVIVYNMQGVEIKKLQLNTWSNGKFSAKIEGKEFTNGIYLIKVNTENSVVVKRLSVIKQ